jgi:DNA-binding transcriptional LysR family regulator
VDELQLPHLETFCKAAELSSFTAAAQALHLTQAAVSQRIAALEKALGKPVFQRQRGRVALSPAGRTVYDYAQRILDLHRELRGRIAGQKAAVTGELLLAASSVPGEHLLPALLADFRIAYPKIQVRATIRHGPPRFGGPEDRPSSSRISIPGARPHGADRGPGSPLVQAA